MIFTSASALGMLAFAMPAQAQDDPVTAVDAGVFAGDNLTVGVGAVASPSYDGSDDYVISVFPAIRGKVQGIGINPRAGGIALDVIDDDDQPVSFSFGPTARLRTDRDGKIKDEVVKRLGDLDTALEIGPSAGVSFNGVLHEYDTVSMNVDVKWDVLGAHDGMTISPSISYFTPLSRGIVTILAVSAEHGNDKFNDYYYSISPAGAVASGLPEYEADGGWNSAGATLIMGVDLDGDLTNGGLALVGVAGYSRQLGDAKKTPLTSIRGDADQFFGGAGIAYTF
ncbi:MipA/OmpV family protein [Altererythrobacter endophyticus]|uniref:MipA/OmpV family protein n=1 Tax=Altericroceibacterium endophyticum TaxID=1808508 RepID=A0A6I4T753_9SPHN|nr:MipA/OmpV family protein [Altericroceibacterium endophyticum]